MNRLVKIADLLLVGAAFATSAFWGGRSMGILGVSSDSAEAGITQTYCNSRGGVCTTYRSDCGTISYCTTIQFPADACCTSP